MTITEFIVDYLMPAINYENSQFVKERLAVPFDFEAATIQAIREVGRQNRVAENIISIPLAQGVPIYQINPDLYDINKMDYVRPLALHRVSSDGGIIAVDDPSLEEIETRNIIDLNRLAFRKNQTHVELKFNSQNSEGVPVGVLTTITAVGGSTISFTENVGSIVAQTYAINLSQANYGVYASRAVTGIAGTTPKTATFSETHTWAIGDIVYFATGLPECLWLIYQAIPKLSYYAVDTVNTIPIMPSLIDKLIDIAVMFIYRQLKDALPGVYGRMYYDQRKIVKDTMKEIAAIVNADIRTMVSYPYTPFAINYEY